MKTRTLLLLWLCSALQAVAWAGTRDVLLVGNSVSGSVSIFDAQSLSALGTVNVIPDLEQRLADIESNPLHQLLYRIILKGQKLEHFEPSNGDRFVDDVMLSPDGRRLYVSRANLGDVAAFDLGEAGFPMLWRFEVSARKADHAALSPDGTRIAVSASLAGKVQVIETEHGTEVGSFKAGTLPHQNDFSADGKRIYTGSIGWLNLPHSLNALKGRRQLTVTDATTFKVIRSYAFDAGLRPSVISGDESILFAQLSYLNGAIKFDLNEGKTLLTSEQPMSPFALEHFPKPDDFPHNSAHHGLALSGDHSKLCDVGTIDGTVSILDASDLSVRSTIDVGILPYWATTSSDGMRCYVTLSGEDAVSVIDFQSGQQVARLAVGRFPQRNRVGRLSDDAVALLSLRTP